MNQLIRRLRENLRHIGARSIAFALAVLLVTAGIATYAGLQIHARQKENLYMRGKLNALEATMEYNRYLLTRADIVTMAGNTVEDLLESGTGREALEKYLTDETENIISSLDPGTTGLYGWLDGAYIDGAGWVPDEGYVATERPWYVKTVRSDKAITLVDPYLDAQTNTVMMTVSKLLGDGVSVLAMDVNLGPIQEIIEQVSASTKGGQAFLLDENGIVIAHSDEGELGKNYMDEPDSLGGIVARRLIEDGQMQFEARAPEGNYTVYIDGLEGGWYSVSAINVDVWHKPLHRTMFAFSLILALVLLSIVAVFLQLTAKNAALQELHDRVDREEKRGVALQALSETDRMTGLNDRVSGERKVSELLGSGSRGMFLELDIDHFKAINDTFGHQTGDVVILAVADAMRRTFRTNDVVMRLGGDEFGAYAVGIASREMGTAIIERLFDRIDRLEIPQLRREKVCVSVGVALCPEGKTPSFQEMYAVADEALYASKKTAGNCVTFGE